MTPNRIHDVLRAAFDTVLRLHGQTDALSSDANFAIGVALGAISKASGLVARDIEQQAHAHVAQTTSPRQT